MPVPPQPVQVICPQCAQPFVARIHTVIDVGKEPQLKDELLSGRLNVTRCPACGAQGHLGAPCLYHDPDKELCVCLVPLELQLDAETQERLIGTMTNALMDSLPQEERRAYMFQPEIHVSMKGFIEAILLADGVTQEMLDAQTQRLELIQDLLDVGEDEERLKGMVEEHGDELDYEFFLILNGVTESTRQAGDEVTTRRLIKLRERLATLTGGPAGALPEPWPQAMSREEIIRELLKTPEDWLPQLVAVNRPAFDYGFFQTLTDHIEAAERAGDTAGSGQLQSLRDRLVEITMQVDRQVSDAVQQAANLLGEILDADDPKQAIDDNLDRIDDLFLAVLTSNIAEAQAQGANDAADLLEGLYGYILSQLEARLPPDIQLVNRLLRIPDAEQRTRVMEEETGLVTPGFLGLVRALSINARQGNEPHLSEQLAALAGEVEAVLEPRA